ALKLTIGRFGQVGIEMLLVTGVLIFPPKTLPLLTEIFQNELLGEEMIVAIFWTATGLVVLSLLYAVWRNLSAISMILAEGAKSTLFNPGVTAFALKAVFFVVLAYWMYLLLPLDTLPAGVWAFIAAAGFALVVLFSRRFVFWHGVWRSSVNAVLESGAREGTPNAVSGHLGDWNLLMEEAVLPAGALCAGKSIAELNLPARFGVSILQMERNGLVMPALPPSTILSAGDRLLLAGPRESLAGASGELSQGAAEGNSGANLQELVMGSFAVGKAFEGKTLAELRIPARTGVRVVGIERGGARILSPGGTQRLEPGDHLLTVGTMEAQRLFGKLARS
ncbi:MAG TPA: TrkA C-terminal domain-containing protein, partial [Opitutales bacterium]|nr:TrkA C-terminal domain-containing protein [Opitutales bacterium]